MKDNLRSRGANQRIISAQVKRHLLTRDMLTATWSLVTCLTSARRACCGEDISCFHLAAVKRVCTCDCGLTPPLPPTPPFCLPEMMVGLQSHAIMPLCPCHLSEMFSPCGRPQTLVGSRTGPNAINKQQKWRPAVGGALMTIVRLGQSWDSLCREVSMFPVISTASSSIKDSILFSKPQDKFIFHGESQMILFAGGSMS